MSKAIISRFAWIKEETVIGLIGMSLPNGTLKVGSPSVLCEEMGPRGQNDQGKELGSPSTWFCFSLNFSVPHLSLTSVSA